MLVRIARGLILGYRYGISPFLAPCCRFHPSCSSYGLEAFERHGFVRGLWLTASRIGRCHPWHPGGVDLVPPTRSDPVASLVGQSSSSCSCEPSKRPHPDR